DIVNMAFAYRMKDEKPTDEIDAFGLSVANGQYRDIIDQSYGILCLSAKEDSLLMWSHYGNSHKGYVIEFDTSHKFFKRYPDTSIHLW
uniref:DUF2971 domain-containing protein n=1 Tax=Vibrio cholerae TaxID=666 RepID=UPI0020CD2CC1